MIERERRKCGGKRSADLVMTLDECSARPAPSGLLQGLTEAAAVGRADPPIATVNRPCQQSGSRGRRLTRTCCRCWVQAGGQGRDISVSASSRRALLNVCRATIDLERLL